MLHCFSSLMRVMMDIQLTANKPYSMAFAPELVTIFQDSPTYPRKSF